MSWIGYLWMALTGALGGFLSGLLGIGGALIFIPVFSYLIRIEGVGQESVPYLLANSFVVVCVAGLAATYRQYKLNNTFPKTALHIAIPATLVALTVSFLVAMWASQSSINIKLLFKFFFLLVLVLIVVQSFMGKKSKDYVNMPQELVASKKIVAGVLVGFFSGITGLGGGSIMLPLFHNFYKIKYTAATSLSSTVIPIFALPTVIYYSMQTPLQSVSGSLQSGYICWNWVLPMLPFIVLFSQIGVKKNHQFPLWITKVIFAAIIIVNIVKILIL